MNDSECKSKSSKSTVVLTNKHIGWLISFVIMLLFFSFITGYFLGQKKAVEHFSGKIEHDSFGDQVYSSMCALYDVNDDVEKHGGESESPNGQSEEIAEKNDDDSKNEPIIHKHEEIPKKVYYAQLIGFGNENNAKKFANRVQQKDIPVAVLKRMSKTARGKVVPWYQVVTEDFKDKEKLEIVVAQLKKEEKLHDVRIIIR